MLNREQRRAYQKKIKKNSAASICPECGNLTLFYTTSLGEKNTVVKCQTCDATIREGEEVTKLVPPGITLPLSLDRFDQALLWEASHPREEEVKNDNSGVQSGDTEAHRESSEVSADNDGQTNDQGS